MQFSMGFSPGNFVYGSGGVCIQYPPISLKSILFLVRGGGRKFGFFNYNFWNNAFTKKMVRRKLWSTKKQTFLLLWLFLLEDYDGGGRGEGGRTFRNESCLKNSSRQPFLNVVVFLSTSHYHVGLEKFKNNRLSHKKGSVYVSFVPFVLFYKFETRTTFPQMKLEGWNLVYRFVKVPKYTVKGSAIQTIIYLYQ